MKDQETKQCSCCGAIGKYFGQCENCWGCGPEGENHLRSLEVFSEERLDQAIADMHAAIADVRRIRNQRGQAAVGEADANRDANATGGSGTQRDGRPSK